MNSGKVLLGVLGGVAVGALMGVLFAPEKGSKTRKRIMNKGKDFADEVKGKFEELYENVTDKHEMLLHDTKDLAAKNEMKP